MKVYDKQSHGERGGMHPSLGGRALVAVLLVALAACSNIAPEGLAPVYSVKGTVLVKGAPAEGAIVVLHQVAESGSSVMRPSGKVTADGSFEITTFVTGDGAPSGEYVAIVIWPEPAPPDLPAMEEGPDRLGGRYAVPKRSKWRVLVEQQPVELEPFLID